ncbi:MAG TPA: hypothetical protein VM290_10585 [Gaiellaceae bacterium]|nr:hypothetical protein [Gaiellaceae bacterium]
MILEAVGDVHRPLGHAGGDERDPRSVAARRDHVHVDVDERRDDLVVDESVVAAIREEAVEMRLDASDDGVVAVREVDLVGVAFLVPVDAAAARRLLHDGRGTRGGGVRTRAAARSVLGA